MDCAICFDPLSSGDIVRLPCGHSFHARCICDAFMNHHTKCALCRAPFHAADEKDKMILTCLEVCICSFVLLMTFLMGTVTLCFSASIAYDYLSS